MNSMKSKGDRSKMKLRKQRNAYLARLRNRSTAEGVRIKVNQTALVTQTLVKLALERISPDQQERLICRVSQEVMPSLSLLDFAL